MEDCMIILFGGFSIAFSDWKGCCSDAAAFFLKSLNKWQGRGVIRETLVVYKADSM